MQSIKPEATEFRSTLGFKQHDIILSKEQSVMPKITKLFSNEKILLGMELICIFLSIDQLQNLMKKDTLTEMKENKIKEKKK